MDRLSSLPDEIVRHILSFLPTKEATLTFLLSKRFKNLFAFTPNLYFDDFDIHGSNNSNYPRFVDFVDKALAMSSDSPLKKFTLKHRQRFDADRVNHWICIILNRGVLDLELFLILKDEYSLPLELFYCKTLVNLQLGSLFDLDMIPKDSYLPSLKTLVLGTIRFSNETLEAILNACPILEELTIIGQTWFDTVSSPTLKRLIINRGHVFEPSGISFDTPNLVYLDYCDGVADEYPTVNLTSLVEAKLSLSSRKSNPTNLINGLRNVKILNLSSVETLEVFSSSAESFPVFENLSSLSITTKLGWCWNSVPSLVKNPPNLKTLIINGPLHFYEENEEEYECTCKCLCGYSFLLSCPVKVLEITEYRGTKRDLQQMKHFLEKLPCLELVKVHAYPHAKSPSTKDIVMLPRACTMELFNFKPLQSN